MPVLRRLRPLALAAIAALIFAAAHAAFAQQRSQPSPQLVESVEVMGNRRHAREELFRHIKTQPGDPFDEAQMLRDFQALLGLGHFDRRGSRVFTETGHRGGVVVVFEMWELPLIESVAFEGLPDDDVRALRDGLRRRGLEMRAGIVFNVDRLNEAVRVIERVLRVRGWYNVVVEVRDEEVSATSVRLTFVVRGLPPEKRFAPKKSDKLRRRDTLAALVNRPQPRNTSLTRS